MFTYLNARLVYCHYYKTSVSSKRYNRLHVVIFRISVVMSKRVIRAHFVICFPLSFYGVLVMIDHDAGRQIRFMIAAGPALTGLTIN